jgi:hypothetical protein
VGHDSAVLLVSECSNVSLSSQHPHFTIQTYQDALHVLDGALQELLTLLRELGILALGFMGCYILRVFAIQVLVTRKDILL